MAWEICTKEDVIALYPILEADLLDIHSDMVEGLIREYMGAPHLGAAVAIADEYHNGDGNDIIAVYKPPIVSVQSVTVSDALIPASDYVTTEHTIQLLYDTFEVGRANVVLDYTSGSSTVPGSARMAATAMVIALLNYKERHGSDGSLIWGVPAETRQEGGERSPAFNIGLISHLKRIMVGMLKREKVRVL
jgi:hypothetical protein